MKEGKTKTLVLSLIGTALSVALGFVLYKVVTKMIGQPNEVEDTLLASGMFSRRTRRGFPSTTEMQGTKCNCGTSMNPRWVDCKLGAFGTCEDCCSIANEPKRAQL